MFDICFINIANHEKKQHNISFNEVRLSHGCFFERLNRVLQQQVQLRVVHVGLASLSQLPFFGPRWCKFQLVGVAHHQNLWLFLEAFWKKNTAFLWSNHFMSKIILSTCAGTNWTDLNVEVSARPWPNIPNEISSRCRGCLQWSNGPWQLSLLVTQALRVPRQGNLHLWNLLVRDSQRCFFVFFWVVCRPFSMRKKLKKKHVFFFKVGCRCCGFESRFWDVPFWGHAVSHLSLLEEGSHSHQVGRSRGE